LIYIDVVGNGGNLIYGAERKFLLCPTPRRSLTVVDGKGHEGAWATNLDKPKKQVHRAYD